MTQTPPHTPALRFPEFRGAGAWEVKRIEDVCSKIPQGGTPSTTKPDYWNGSINWLTPAEMGKTKDRFMHTTVRKITELGLKKCSSDLLPINSIIVSTRAPIGYLTINKTEMAFNQGCKGLVPNKTTSYDFLYYTLLFYKNSLIDLGSGSTFKELTGNNLKNFKVTFPSLEEQEKIAACLSSLDEMITAHSDKLDGLKDYKRGLMQHLFPAKGETTPTLRFPEFRGKDPWEVKRLGELSKIIRGASPRPIDGFLTHESNGLNWLKIGDVDKEEKYVTKTKEKIKEMALNKTKEVNPNDLIMSNSMSFGRPYILKINACIHDGWIAIRDINISTTIDYLYYFILSDNSQIYFANAAAGSGVRNLNIDIVKSLLILLPPLAEQQKIADCLSAMDELITAQADKIETLKIYKKGLMQQLFPKL